MKKLEVTLVLLKKRGEGEILMCERERENVSAARKADASGLQGGKDRHHLLLIFFLFFHECLPLSSNFDRREKGNDFSIFSQISSFQKLIVQEIKISTNINSFPLFFDSSRNSRKREKSFLSERRRRERGKKKRG